MIRAHAGRLAAAVAVGSLAVATSFLGIAAPAAAAPAVRYHPRIVANPNNLMVNTKTTLTGTGFGVDAKLRIVECSRTKWMVPVNPCAKGNAVTVRATSEGSFTATFTAKVCPKIKNATGRGFSEVCYVGALKQLFGRVKLLGAAKLTVTGP
jgi:hypothetical protein